MEIHANSDIYSACSTPTVASRDEIFVPTDSAVKPNIEEMPKYDFPIGIEEIYDTRAHRAVAGRIKHEQRSVWRHRNMGCPVTVYENKYVETMLSKPWRAKEYPGKLQAYNWVRIKADKTTRCFIQVSRSRFLHHETPS